MENLTIAIALEAAYQIAVWEYGVEDDRASWLNYQLKRRLETLTS